MFGGALDVTEERLAPWEAWKRNWHAEEDGELLQDKEEYDLPHQGGYWGGASETK